jgi:hypothetical protein
MRDLIELELPTTLDDAALAALADAAKRASLPLSEGRDLCALLAIALSHRGRVWIPRTVGEDFLAACDALTERNPGWCRKAAWELVADLRGALYVACSAAPGPRATVEAA